MPFQKATKQQSRLRVALAGPAGAGKTWTSLLFGSVFKGDGRLALIDTERGSASKYADQFEFDVLELESFHPQKYADAIHDAEKAGYTALVIDSLSHAWSGKDGALEQVDKIAKRSQSSNSFGAWREVTPLHNMLVDAMLGANLHLIVTLRSKQDYVQQSDERGKTVIRKVGMAPVQRDGLEYEFDIFGEMDFSNTLSIGKTRCPALQQGIFEKPGAVVAETMYEWATSGAPGESPTLRKMRAAYGKLIEKGAVNGVSVPALRDDATEDEIESLGADWKPKVQTAEKERLEERAKDEQRPPAQAQVAVPF